MLTPFKKDELREISISLEDYHAVFYTFFEMANVYYCDATELTTAAVRFHTYSLKPDLILNREFWEGLTHRERLFVICHECLHVILLHDQRLGYSVVGATARLINIAQDITINEMIVSMFNFNRNELRDWKRFCWIDTCFDHPGLIKRDQTFIYYLELLVKDAKPNLPDLLDVHGGEGAGAPGEPRDAGGDMSPEARDNMQSVAERLAEELDPGELEGLLNAAAAGLAGSQIGASSIGHILADKQKRSKVEFVKLIRHLKRSRIKVSEGESESFAAEDRRYVDVMKRNNVTIPGHRIVNKPSKDRLLTALFMDVSPSVIDFLPIFDKVFAAFDVERELFEIRTFVFDTTVREVSPGQKIYPGYGTNFHIIEAKVQELKAEYGKYPDAVVIITDGEGTNVAPEVPGRWVWLLSPHPSLSYIHAKSKSFLISDVVF